jgi:hypothetical protein
METMQLDLSPPDKVANLATAATKSWALTHHHEIAVMCIHHPYLFTFGRDYVDIWRLHSGNALEHLAELSEAPRLPDLERTKGVVVDVERGVVMIANAPTPPIVLSYRLTDGMLVDSLYLDGPIQLWPSPYLNGRTLLATRGYGDESRPDGVSRITNCEWSSSIEQFSVQHVGLPMNLRHREAKRSVTECVLVPLVLSAGGDIIGASAESYTQTMEVLLWRGSDYDAGQEPDARLELSMLLKDGHLIGPECSALMEDDTFLLCVSESLADVVHCGRSSQIVIYCIATPSLTVRWRADPILGLNCTINFAPALGVAIAIGQHRAQQGTGWMTWIAVLDKDTGTCLRMEVINHKIVGVPVVTCTVSQCAENPDLVVVFKDGDYIISDLRAFVASGLERHGDDGSLKVTKAFKEPETVQSAAVGDGTLVMLLASIVKDSAASSEIRYVTW